MKPAESILMRFGQAIKEVGVTQVMLALRRSLIVALLATNCAMAGLTNGNFESAWVGWQSEGWWGSSPVSLPSGEGRSGTTALKMVCAGNRGMMVQELAAYPGNYTAGIWLKCSGISGADARLAVEWFNSAGTWIGYSFVGSVTGTADWTYHYATVSAPAGTWRAKVTLYTTDANNGTAWFDDVTFARVAPYANLLTNPGFESGMAGWDPNQSWYGTSPASVVAGEGRLGTQGLRIDGNGSRGIVIQNPAVSSGDYTLSGWVKCTNMGSVQVRIQVEWLDASWGYAGWGGPVGAVSGDSGWTYIEGVKTAPGNAAYAAIEMVTANNNSGVAWYDDITFVRVPDPFPAPPALGAQTPAGREGCLQVTWSPAALPSGTVVLHLYCETNAVFTDTMPRLAAESAPGSAMLWSLQNGRTYALAAKAADADGRLSSLSSVTYATVSDRQPPRSGHLVARRELDGHVRVGWSPHVLDADITKIRFSSSGGAVQLAELDVTSLYDAPRPVFCTEPWLTVVTNVPGGTTEVGVECEDSAGNVSTTAWTSVMAAHPTNETAPCVLWTAPPTTQLQQNATAPPGSANTFELTLMGGQSKGFQVMIRPSTSLSGARIGFDPLLHEDGETRIETHWLAYHFVDYVALTANSIYTPPAEQVWSAPAGFPDELSDDTTRDMPAGQTQPVYVRVAAPPDAKAGTYTGRGWVECTVGRRSFTLTVNVSSLQLPSGSPFHVGQWFKWDLLCNQFGVDMYSEDAWRALSRLAKTQVAYRHHFVKVPWDMIRSWRKADGTLAHDYHDFDRFVGTFLQQDANHFFGLSHMGGRAYSQWECPTMRSHDHRVPYLDSAEDELMDVVELLPAIETHVTARGWLDRFGVYVADEPIAENLATYRALSARVNAAAPTLRRLDAVIIDDLLGYLEIWAPMLDYFDTHLATFRAAQAAGNELWFYVAWVPQGSYPNRLLDSFAVKPRVLHWLNGIYDTSGYMHWALNWWDVPLTYLNSPGDQYIVWPSQRFIVDSSLRFEAEREGLDDWQLMVMLRNVLRSQGLSRSNAQARVEVVARQAVRDFTDYTHSWHELEAARIELLRELERASQPFLVSITPSGGTGIALHWNGYSGVTYSVMASTDLLASHAGFGTVDVHEGTEGTNYWTDIPAGHHRFYRLGRPTPTE